MSMKEADDRAGKRRAWLIVFVASLFTLAVFWAIDRSILYILMGFSAFSLYMVLQNRRLKKDQPNFGSRYQQPYANKPSFWDGLGNLFNSDQTKSNPAANIRIVRVVLAVFVGVIFFSILVPIMLSDGSSERATENLQKARDLYNAGAYDSSAYFYRSAIDHDPENADLYLERGNAFLNSNRYDSAWLDYNQAIRLRPDFKEAFYNLGLIHFNRKQYRDGINTVKKALASDPEYSNAMALIGDCFYNSSQLDSALIWYEGAYARGYVNAELTHLMAYIYDTRSETQRAISFYQETLSYDSTRTEIYSRLGELLPGKEGNIYRQKAAQYQPR
jgi:tetratricopeptide (TPR) repeat protein